MSKLLLEIPNRQIQHNKNLKETQTVRQEVSPEANFIIPDTHAPSGPLNLSVSLSLTNRTLRMLSSLKMMSMSPCTVLNGRFPTYAVNGGSVGSSFCFLGPPGPLPPRGLMGGGTEDRQTGTQVKRIVWCRGQDSLWSLNRKWRGQKDLKAAIGPVMRSQWLYELVARSRPFCETEWEPDQSDDAVGRYWLSVDLVNENDQ